MRKLLSIMLMIVMVLGVTSIVFAQDTEPMVDDTFTDVDQVFYADPDPVFVTDMANDATIEAITDNSTDYYGAVVTIEAQLMNMIGTRIFELGQAELFSDSRVLVVNNTNETLPASLVEGATLRITGRVHPSYDVVQRDANWTYTPFDDTLQQQEQGRMNMVNFVHRGYVPDVFGQHTVVELLNVENIEVLGYNNLLTPVE